MSGTESNGGPAFPVTINGGTPWAGISMRDYFAAASLQGLLAFDATCSKDRGYAEDSYRLADEMIKARKEASRE